MWRRGDLKRDRFVEEAKVGKGGRKKNGRSEVEDAREKKFRADEA
jgi:hypothetical protein